MRAKALGIPLSSAGEATMLRIAWLRQTQGDEVAKRVLAWAIGTRLTVLAFHERCCVDTLRQKIDASLAAVEREFSEAPQAKNPEAGASRTVRAQVPGRRGRGVKIQSFWQCLKGTRPIRP